jgi:hypothetical protein
MAKQQYTYQKKLGMAVSAGVLLCIVMAIAVYNSKKLFGIYIPVGMAEQINHVLAVGLGWLAIALHRQRRAPTNAGIAKMVLWFVSFVLFVIGWRFVAGDTYILTPISDGFTVTGGFMMLFAGLIAGWLLTTLPRTRKK